MENSDSQPVVWIVGEGVLIEGIATSLEGQKTMKLVRWEKLNLSFVQRALDMKPTMIIFELDSPGSYRLLNLLKEHPGIQMLGIDRNCGQVVVLSSFRMQSKTMLDLYNIVTDVTGKASRLQNGGDLLDKGTTSSR